MARTPGIALLLAAWLTPVPAQDVPPSQAVRGALEDYLRALYDAEPARIERSVSQHLTKLGLWHDRDGDRWQPSAMSYERLLALAGTWNAKSDRVPPGSVGQVEVLEVADDIACGVIEAVWGTDYAHLVRDDDGSWRIRHILWQSWPGEPGARKPITNETKGALERVGYGYLDGYYRSDPQLTERSVHPELVKLGILHEGDARTEHAMTFAELRTLCAKPRQAPADPPREVEILDTRSHTALVRVVGIWGFDYLSLARESNGWQIRHAVWQRSPKRAPVRPGARWQPAAGTQPEEVHGQRSGVEPHQKTLAAVLEAHPDHAWAGLYHTGPGLTGRTFHLAPDGRFTHVDWGCVGSSGAVGIARPTRGGFALFTAEDTRMPPFLHTVRWGPRVYLVRDRRLQDFVDDVNNGWLEAQSTTITLLRADGHGAEVEGLPDLPEPYRSQLRATPLTPKTTAVEVQNRHIVLRFDQGARKGLKRGMELRDPRTHVRGKITEVTDDTCTAVVPRTPNTRRSKLAEKLAEAVGEAWTERIWQ